MKFVFSLESQKVAFEVPDFEQKKLTFCRPSPFSSKQNKTKNFQKDFKGPELQLSDFPMKKQIVFGQIWKRLVIIVVDLNYYELILMNINLKLLFISSF